jgi:hypothetical protein
LSWTLLYACMCSLPCPSTPFRWLSIIHISFLPEPFFRSGLADAGIAGASGGGFVPHSTIQNQYDSDMQRALQVTSHVVMCWRWHLAVPPILLFLNMPCFVSLVSNFASF